MDHVKIPFKANVQKFGALPDIDAGESGEDIWDQTGAYTFLTEATALTISSSSTADTAAGTGARTIVVVYQDANNLEQTATITMNGQSAAATTITALRVYRAYVVTVGSGGVNAGDIYIGSGTITSGVPANKYAKILVNNGQTLMAIYTVPADYASGVITRWYGACGGAASARSVLSLETRESGQSWRVRNQHSIAEGGGFDHEFSKGVEIGVGCDIRIRVAQNGTANTAITAGFDIGLV